MDLKTTYLGLQLKNPVIPSASPLSKTVEMIQRLEEAGAGAVVVHSLFEEQVTMDSIQLDHYLSYGAQSHSEALSYFPEMETYNIGPEGYLDLIRKAKKKTDIPIIASLNGISPGGWTRYAQLMQEAGADAVELNVYFVSANPEMTGEQVEKLYLDLITSVRKKIKIPIAVKVGPFFSAFANMAKRMQEKGANGLVLFNRFYQPDFDLENLEVVPNVVLSRSSALRLPLRWTAILYGRVKADLAITGGIHSHEDVLKAMMAGASAAQMASELLQNGVGRIGEILKEMKIWMEKHEYDSVKQMRGSMSQRHVAEPAAFERANYMKALHSFRQDPTGRRL